MKIIVISTMLFSLLVLFAIFADDVIKSEVDSNSLKLNEDLVYKVIITSYENKIPQPRFPEFKGFDILSSAESSTISFKENRIKTLLVYVFILKPKEAGRIKIGPSSVRIKGELYYSDAFDIEVSPDRESGATPLDKKSDDDIDNAVLNREGQKGL